MYILYTDGSCKGNGKSNSAGAWAYILLDGENEICKESKAYNNTTNNKMELMAVIEGIKAVLERNEDFFDCRIFTDSAYIHNCYKQKWYIAWQRNNWINSKKEPVKNRELWEELIPYFEDIRFNFLKVKGHNGDIYNEMVDTLAQNEAFKLIKKGV